MLVCALLIEKKVNCLHEIFFDAALETARILDDHYTKTGKPLGPLHGLPVSLKDQFHVKGVETTMGYVGWINTFQGKTNDPRYLTHESELVKELRAAGAVLYCKTSVPMTLMSGETMNNIITYTHNPKNRLLSSGGSSGGEGALIALRGSPAGFGTDIGGSIRVPASFNGLYGIRPSVGRMPYEGAANSGDGQNTVLSVVGPLSPSARGLILLFKTVLGAMPWLGDPGVLEIPWREEIVEETRKLVQGKPEGLAFGIFYDDGQVKPQPPVERAMRIAAETIKRLGHKVSALLLLATLLTFIPAHQLGTPLSPNSRLPRSKSPIQPTTPQPPNNKPTPRTAPTTWTAAPTYSKTSPCPTKPSTPP